MDNKDLITNRASAPPSTAKEEGVGVLHICSTTAHGGVERGTLNTMRLMEAYGYRSIVACHADGEQLPAAKQRGFEYVPCHFDWMQRTLRPDKLSRYLVGLRRESNRILRVCKEKNIRILVPHGHVSVLYARKAAERLNIPMLFHVHDARPPTSFSLMAQRWVMPVVTHTICVSKASARMMVDSGMPADKVQVIYNALNNPAYLGDLPDPTPEVSGPGPHFGLVALIVPFKGQKIFLLAARQILEKMPTAQFYIVGPLCHPDHQDFLDELHSMAEEEPLKGHVTFTGQRDDVPRWVMAMDALVMASTIPEALPNVVLEALALGRRMVATNHGGQLEIIRDGETGLFVPPGDPSALASALMDLAGRPANDPMGQRAMDDVRHRFGPERFAREMAEVYSKLLSGTPV